MLTKELVSLILDAQHLDIDEALHNLGITHLELRQAHRYHKLEGEIPMTEGLRIEIDGMSRNEVSRQYHIDLNDINRLLYHEDQHKRDAMSYAQYLRSQGWSELMIGQECGTRFYDKPRLAKELQQKRDDGARVIDLASDYGIVHSRISQLTNASRPYKRLAPAERQEIKESTKPAKQLAKEYNVGINTIYVIKREP